MLLLYNNSRKSDLQICFFWVHSHTKTDGNAMADYLTSVVFRSAQQSTNGIEIKQIETSLFFPKQNRKYAFIA